MWSFEDVAATVVYVVIIACVAGMLFILKPG